MYDEMTITLKSFDSNISPYMYTVSSPSLYFCYQKIIYEDGDFIFFVTMNFV